MGQTWKLRKVRISIPRQRWSGFEPKIDKDYVQGEGNGNPLQCSCLENPRDGVAWWAAFCGVTQSRTRPKWLSSSSSTQTNWLWNHFFHMILSSTSFTDLDQLLSVLWSLTLHNIHGDFNPLVIRPDYFWRTSFCCWLLLIIRKFLL